MRNWLIAFSVLVLSACATSLLPSDFAEVRGTVARVENASGLGSGTFIRSNVVLTAGHMIQNDQEEFTVTRYDGSTTKATVLWRSETMDVALLKTEVSGPYASLDCAPLDVGTEFFTIGNPMKFPWLVTRGFVSSSRLVEEDSNLLPQAPPKEMRLGRARYASADWEGGDSGSALFNHDGKIIGTVSGGLLDKGRLTDNSFFMPASEFCPEIKAALK